MNKAALLRIINPVLFLSFVVQGATGLILFFDLKVPGEELVSNIHGYNGLFMIVLAGTHLFLNWSWVQANFFKKKA